MNFKLASNGMKSVITAAALALAGCSVFAAAPTASPETGPTAISTPTLASTQPAAAQETLPTLPSPTATATPLPDTGWRTLRPGIEQRLITLFDQQGSTRDRLYLLRLEPASFRFAVGYQPGQPRSLHEWLQESGALLVVNGGFFTPEFIATGMTVVDGEHSGSSFQGFGGMVLIRDGSVSIRDLASSPYDPAETYQFGLQSFPMLVRSGGTTSVAEDDGIPSRRTVIAQDTQGRILFLISPWGSMSLYQLSQFLVQSDLEIDIALNLDGGSSSGALLAEPPEGIPAFTLLPAVITVYPR